MRNTLLFFLLSSSLFSNSVVVPDDYLIFNDKELSYVYSSEYQEILPELQEYQKSIIKGYEKEYGFKLDEKLYVGLASNNNQIANGFSTQFPFNSQLLYGAGAGYIDYFCFSSWLKTLIVHETAHNFQLNPKENDLSRISHKILGNTPVSILGLLPLFPVPNVTESSFILEGNAVLNESRYGNGGRLFSGYALAEVIALANANQITPELMYNPTLSFPYGEKFYLVGGFFQQFLVNKFGINKVNGYFKTYATQPFPFFTNWMFEKQYGKDFETLLAEFVVDLKQKHQEFRVSNGKLLAKSQTFTPLNRNSDEVYTLISDNKSAPKIFMLSKLTNEVNYEEGSWFMGEAFKYDGLYYTQSSGKISPTKISMGLFDSEGYILENTEGKSIQGYMDNGQEIYFDMKSSIESPQVYVNGAFYTQSHSSVFVDKNDLYYFKQEGETRILYKNKKALFQYQGHYGFVSDIDKLGSIYFIAPSKHGSSVYRFYQEKVQRVYDGDDIIDYKIINENEAIVATVGAGGYRYLLTDKKEYLNEIPYAFNLFTKPINKAFNSRKFKNSQSLKFPKKEYSPVAELQYTSLNQALFYETDKGLGLNLQANFSDPLMQNSLALILSHDNERSVGGIHYENVAHPIEFGGSFYGASNKDVVKDKSQNFGSDGYIRYPFLATGYCKGSATLAYSNAYDDVYREPFTLSLDIFNHKQFGFSKYVNSLNALSFFATKERTSNIFGASYLWEHDMPWQSYIGFRGDYLKSNEVDFALEKGIKLSNTFNNIQADRATFDMPTLSKSAYAKELKMAEMSLKKVFDISIYNYSLPLSLQRESIYFKQRLYDIDFTDRIHKKYNESIVGTELDLLLFHNFTLPLNVEYLYNPDVEDTQQVRFFFGSSF